MNTRFIVYAAVMIVVLAASTGCVTFAKTIVAGPVPVPTQDHLTEPIVWKEVNPEPVAYIENYREPENLFMYRTGGRYLGEAYHWHRENCSGLKDMDVNVTVYGYRILPGYQWWSVSWGRYFYQAAWHGQKYLFVFVRMEMVGDSNDKDPRMYGMGQDHFYAQYGNDTYQPDRDHELGVRIRQLENTATMNDDVFVYDYGYQRAYTYNGTEFAQDLGYLRMGKSNAWDGYIIYSVPVEAAIEDLYILGRFDGFGSAWWKLVTKPQ